MDLYKIKDFDTFKSTFLDIYKKVFDDHISHDCYYKNFDFFQATTSSNELSYIYEASSENYDEYFNSKDPKFIEEALEDYLYEYFSDISCMKYKRVLRLIGKSDIERFSTRDYYNYAYKYRYCYKVSIDLSDLYNLLLLYKYS